ncbi:MAG: hypothetical protein JWM04_2711, partial [Verrucomicrobiales bacterium]|nr:hypothetical protein [Verrucomicrobiales bacterium]
AEAAHKVGFLRKQPEIDGIYALEALNEVLQQMSLPSLEKK